MFRISLFMLLTSANLPAQISLADKYADVDASAIAFGTIDNFQLREQTLRLTDEWSEPELKARAIYTWITHHVAYNTRQFHWRFFLHLFRVKETTEKVLKKDKSMCSGYSLLFTMMCHYCGISTMIISGYGKTEISQIKKKPRLARGRHAWNLVEIDGKWQPVDCTWGAGGCDKHIRHFQYQFNSGYFLTPPRQFIYNHLPKDKKWQLLDTAIGKSRFFSGPLPLDDFFQSDVKYFSPKKGIIKTSTKATKKLVITPLSPATDSSIIVSNGADFGMEFKGKDIEWKNETATVALKSLPPGKYPLVIAINHEKFLMMYWAEVRK